MTIQSPPTISKLIDAVKTDRKLDVLWKVTMPTLALISLVGIVYFLWNVTTLANQYSQEIALRDAIRFHTAVNTFRNYYSTQVVAKLRDSEIEFTHDYLEKEGALPLPATLTRELGTNLSDSTASSMNFYSDLPFPWREPISAADDPFLAEALIFLRENPAESYYRTITNPETGDKVLRYATPSVMQESCIACHNSHPDSPKTDWQVGDVRGVLEVSVPVSSFALNGTAESGSRLIIASVALLLSSLGLLVSGFYFRNVSLRTIEEKSSRLEAEVHERKMTEEKLKAAITDAENANTAKSRFLATMSHELRTPLNAIIGYSEMLGEEAADDGDAELEDGLDRITRSGRHLLTIINDILDLSKIEIGRLDVELSNVDINPLSEYLEDLMHVLIQKDAVKFELKVDPSIGPFYTDETRIRQILFNLLSNASKFTTEGVISLSIEKLEAVSQDFIEFRVKDTGIGMSQKHIYSIFDPFIQLESGTDRKYQGSGLGLAITKNLCELLGGTIFVTSEEGVGTEFTVTLPLKEGEPELLKEGAMEFPGS